MTFAVVRLLLAMCSSRPSTHPVLTSRLTGPQWSTSDPRVGVLGGYVFRLRIGAAGVSLGLHIVHGAPPPARSRLQGCLSGGPAGRGSGCRRIVFASPRGA